MAKRLGKIKTAAAVAVARGADKVSKAVAPSNFDSEGYLRDVAKESQPGGMFSMNNPIAKLPVEPGATSGKTHADLRREQLQLKHTDFSMRQPGRVRRAIAGVADKVADAAITAANNAARSPEVPNRAGHEARTDLFNKAHGRVEGGVPQPPVQPTAQPSVQETPSPTPTPRRTNSAGGSYMQMPAYAEATRLNNSWMAEPAHRYAYNAVVWHQDGRRSEGSWVSPSVQNGVKGITLHQINGGGSFHPENTVDEVHLVERPGVPDSVERENQYQRQQAANEPWWRQ